LAAGPPPAARAIGKTFLIGGAASARYQSDNLSSSSRCRNAATLMHDLSDVVELSPRYQPIIVNMGGNAGGGL
jgi:hypothetical protein